MTFLRKCKIKIVSLFKYLKCYSGAHAVSNRILFAYYFPSVYYTVREWQHATQLQIITELLLILITSFPFSCIAGRI